MVKDELAELIYQAVRKAQKKGDLPKTDIPDIAITRPRQAQRGDYTSNQPLQMIAAVNTALKAADHRPLTPVELGQRIVHRLPQVAFIKQVEVSPPGFINITLDDGWLAQQVEAILAEDDKFGNVDRGHGRRHCGHANSTCL